MRLAVVLMLALAGCGSDHRSPIVAVSEPAVAPAVTTPVATTPDCGFVGVVVASESADVAPRFATTVISIAVTAGDDLPRGAPIAQLDGRVLREQLLMAYAADRAAAAATRQADVDLRDARRVEKIETRAVADGTSPRRTLEDAQFAVARAAAARDRARAAKAEAEARVDQAKSQLDETILTAPFDGVVSVRYRDPGAATGPGAPVIRLLGKGGLRLRFAVTPTAAHAMAPGGFVTASIDTVVDPIIATIHHVAPELDPASGLIFVEAELPGSLSAHLQPGLAARVFPRNP